MKLGVTTHFSELNALQYGEMKKKKIKKLFFFPHFRVYTLTGANAMVIVSRLQNKEQMVK